MTKSLRVLMLESSERDVELIKQELNRAGLAPVTRSVRSESDFASALSEFSPDVVLSDYSPAQFNVCAALQLLRTRRPVTPLIVVSDSMNGEHTVAVVRAGAEDVILKPNLSRLPNSISTAVSIRRPLHRLTPRQIEVLRMVAEGHRTRDIASELKLSVKTVESHRGEVMKRLGMHDVVSLVRYAARIGLITSASATDPSSA
ncbi:MAG TPA: response regulator transcription factor [Gemmatimonadaceae bacterium]